MKRQSELTNVLHMGIAFFLFLATLSVGVGLSFNPAEAQPFAYVTNVTNVSVIDTDPSSPDFNKVVSTIEMGKEMGKPSWIAITPDRTRAYMVHYWSNTVTVINTDPSSPDFNKVVSTIEVGGYPLILAITPDGTRAYVTHHMSFVGNVSVIDTDPSSPDFNKVVSTIEAGGYPGGIAITPDGTRAYVTSYGNSPVLVIDTDPSGPDFNKVVSTIEGADGPPYRVAITPDGTRAYITSTSYSGNNVSVIDTDPSSPDFNKVVSTIEAGPFPAGIAITPDGTRAYVEHLSSGDVSVIDTKTNTLIDTFSIPTTIGTMHNGIAITPDVSHVYVAHYRSVVVIDTSDNSVVDTITMENAYWVAITPTVDTDSYFAAFEVDRARVKLHQNTSGDQFEVWGSCELEATNDGIDILNKDVTVTLGDYSETIAGDDFVREDETFHYQGDSGGITEIKIRDNGRFSVKARGLDLSTISLERHDNPVNFSLQIGGYSGKTEIEFDRKGRFLKGRDGPD